MQPFTKKVWALQNKHAGDRQALFQAVADVVPAKKVFYPGSFVDITASFVFDDVTYLDIDKRAPRFFDDHAGVLEIIAQQPEAPAAPKVAFIHGDYTQAQPLSEQAFDLLFSLYSGFISDHCISYLRIGGTLLANSSHGDVAMASLDSRYQLTGVVKKSGAGGYRVVSDDLDSYLIPKKAQTITRDSLRQSRRGIGYTKTAFAYLFERVA